MDKKSKIYIAGHTGLVGSSIARNLNEQGFTNILTKKHEELDLINQQQVKDFFEKEKPDYVIFAAAKVGGILANNLYRAEFIYDNLQIQNNIIHQSYLHNVKKLLFLGSSCIYPKNCPQPIKEEYLLTSELEYTNEPYAIAKISGMKMCESYNLQYETNFIMLMPTNLYGPNDRYDLEKAHVLPSLIRKIHLAKLLSEKRFDDINKNLNLESFEHSKTVLKKYGITENYVTIWGTGKPRREFLHSDDMADACIYILNNINFKDLASSSKEIRNTHINVGSGKDISIKELAELIKEIVGYKGDLVFDQTKPDGTMQKLLDITKLKRFGWQEKIKLKDGIQTVYKSYTT